MYFSERSHLSAAEIVCRKLIPHMSRGRMKVPDAGSTGVTYLMQVEKVQMAFGNRHATYLNP